MDLAYSLIRNINRNKLFSVYIFYCYCYYYIFFNQNNFIFCKK